MQWKLNNGQDVELKNVIIDELSISGMFDKFQNVQEPFIIKSNIFIQNCTIKKMKFEGCIFKKPFYIIQSEVKEGFHILKSEFFAKVDFHETTFKAGMQFKACCFKETTQFIGAMFKKDAEFWKSTFEKEIIFRSAVFHKMVIFTDSYIRDKADFYGTTFKHKALFSGVEVDKKMMIDGIILEKNSELNFGRIEGIKGKIKFIYIDLSKSSFLYSDMDCFDFINVQWKREKRRFQLYDEEMITQKAINLKKYHKKRKKLTGDDSVKYNTLKQWDKNERMGEIKHTETIYRQLKRKALDKVVEGSCVKLSYSFLYSLSSAFFINQNKVEGSSMLAVIISRFESALVATVLIMSGLAVKRRFVT